MTTRILALGLFLSVFGTAVANEKPTRIDSIFWAVKSVADTVDVEMAIKGFKGVLKIDDQYAPAYEQLARKYLVIDTPDSRRLAEKATRRAINLAPENPEYHLLLGDVMLFRGFRHNAQKHYDKVLKKFPNSAQIAYKSGRNALQEYMLTKDLELHDAPSARMGFAEKAWDRTELLLEKSITLDPNNQDAYYQLGLGHLEHGDPKGLMQAMNRLLKRFPDDHHAILCLGMGLQEQGFYQRAGALYAEALKRMPLEERKILEDVDLIAGEEDSVMLAMTGGDGAWEESVEHRRFWVRRDPLLLTDANERRMEHYRRVAYANLRFGVPSRNVVGWNTVPGQTYIKYGHYLYRSSSASRFLLFSETWYYEDFRFTFNSVNGLDKWGFAGDVGMSSAPDPFSPDLFSGSGVGIHDSGRSVFDEAGDAILNDWFGIPTFYLSRLSAFSSADLFNLRDKEAFEKKPARFVDPFINQKYSLPHLTAAFREGDSMRVELAYAVPLDKLSQDVDVSFDDGVFLFDEAWDKTYRNVTRVEQKVGNKSEHVIRSRTLRVDPGDYYLVAEIGDRKGGSIGTFREERHWEAADTNLVMSDLLLADHIRLLNEFPNGRQDLEIRPQPLRKFERGQSAFVYLELYNLFQNDFGRTRYDISYRIGVPDKKEVDPALFQAMALKSAGDVVVTREEKDEISWGDFDAANIQVQYVVPERNLMSKKLERMIARGRQGETVITSQYEGDHVDDFTFLEIDLSSMPQGVYKLTVMATDVVTRQVVSRSELFQVVE